MTRALYRLMLRSQLSRARVISLLALGAVAIVVAVALRAGDPFDLDRVATRFINVYGLALLVPVTALVFASATLGEPNEDGTLVYLWLRPVARWKIVAAATAASYSVAWPVVIVPLTLAAAATGVGGGLVWGTAVAGSVALVAYCAGFVALGLRVKRALVWGLLYIFVWEGFVARANTTAARLAVRSYASSLLSDATNVSLRLADFTVASSWAVPLSVAAVAFAYTAFRLKRQDVA